MALYDQTVCSTPAEGMGHLSEVRKHDIVVRHPNKIVYNTRSMRKQTTQVLFSTCREVQGCPYKYTSGGQTYEGFQGEGGKLNDK